MNTLPRTNDSSKYSLKRLDAYWRAANYLSVGQIYLLDNPLLRVPLQRSHVKPNLLGHWGTTLGQNFVYAHLNRAIQLFDLQQLECWMKSYRPEELFNVVGKLIEELAELAPLGNRRMGSNPHANGGALLKDLVMPEFRNYAVGIDTDFRKVVLFPKNCFAPSWLVQLEQKTNG
jgi:phosphoketolase